MSGHGPELSVDEVAARFAAVGGRFVTAPARLAERVAECRGIVLDWDGVFNNGAKHAGAGSGFSEADSMGLNLLRFGLWRQHGSLPAAAVITGENNENARQFADREHFDALYSGVRHKVDALDALCADARLDAEHLIVMFDDVNDLGMAERCGVRIMVRRDASPLLADHAIRHHLVDYVTGARAERHAIREAAELLLGLAGMFSAVVDARVRFDEAYAAYFAARQTVTTRFETGSTAP